MQTVVGKWCWLLAGLVLLIVFIMGNQCGYSAAMDELYSGIEYQAISAQREACLHLERDDYDSFLMLYHEYLSISRVYEEDAGMSRLLQEIASNKSVFHAMTGEERILLAAQIEGTVGMGIKEKESAVADALSFYWELCDSWQMGE